MNSDVDALDTGPDWLTVTAVGASHVERLMRQATRYVYGFGATHQWRWLGYVGRRYHDSEGAGGCAYGEKGAGEMGVFQAWGEFANRCGRGIVCGERYWLPGDSMTSADVGPKVTRVDLQVTVLHAAPTPSIHDILAQLPRDKHHFSAVVPLNEEGGTLYIGHRASDMFARLYDKGAQLGGPIPPRLLWRYEVEYKRKPAQECATNLWGPTTTADDRRGYILKNVEHFFREHGMPVPFMAPADDLHSVIRYGTRQQDAEKTLKWLTQQVHPAILRLSLEGKADAVAEALGLTVMDGVPTFEAREITDYGQTDFLHMVD